MRQRLVRILLGLAITLVFAAHAARYVPVELIDRLDSIIYDARLRAAMPGKGDARVVVLDVDEKSLGEVGRWPWSRDVLARLIDRLFDEYGVAVLGFDMVWAERDRSSGMAVLDGLARRELAGDAAFLAAYAKLRPGLDYDARLAESLRGRPVVLGYYLSSEERAVRANALPAPALEKGAFGSRYAPLTHWTGYTGNLAEYQASAAGAGHMNPRVDEDGVVRRVPLLAELDGAFYESLSLAVVRAWLARQSPERKPPAIEPGFPGEGVTGMEWLAVGPLTVPVDEQAQALVPYAGRRYSFDYVPLADVLAGRVKEGALRDKIALVGTSAPTLADLRATPVGNVFPGVEIHANLVAGMIEGGIKRKPAYMVGAEVVLVLLGGAVLSLLIPRLPALWATFATLAGAGLITGLGFVVWTEANTVLPLAASILMAACIYTLNMAFGYFVETRAKRQFTELFGQYVPPELVDQMAADPERYSMKPRAAELTILFADVRGFTGISEALEPEALREYIDAYLTAMSALIRGRHRGTLDKYIGDAIMAFWGAPVDDPRHARKGVLAAMDMQKECAVLNASFARRGWPALRIGVGLNTGSVRVGDMGSRERRAYTAMGDAVNVASRLEGRTKHYGVGVLCGEATRNAVPDVLFREVDRIKVKGRDQAIAVFEPLALLPEADDALREELARWDQVLAAYRARRWDEAAAGLDELLRLRPDCGLYACYAGRIAACRATPPAADWDGVTVFDEK